MITERYLLEDVCSGSELENITDEIVHAFFFLFLVCCRVFFLLYF